MPDYILFALAWFIAGLVNNVAGFGAAMVAMPIIASSVPLNIAVPSSTLIVLTLNFQLGWNYRKYIEWKALRFIFLGGVFGTAAGLLIMKTVDNEALKLAMGLLLIGYALHSLWASRRDKQSDGLDLRWGSVAGFFSTFLGALFGFNGPPLAVFTSEVGWRQDAAKGILGACFILSGTTILAGQIIAGIHSVQTLTYYAVGCPAVLLGGGAGILASRFVKQRVYQTIVLVLILVAGLSVAYSSI